MSEVLKWPLPRGGVTTVGVIGWPVEHSLSPAIHNAAFLEAGLAWEYVHLPVPSPGMMPDAVRELAAGFRGANVTMPHKLDAYRLCARTGEDAALLHAVNTLIVTGGEVSGENTDAPGFANFLREDASFDADNKQVLIYGDGGAARACALALAKLGASRIVTAVRRPPGAGDMPRVVTGLDVDVELVALEDAPIAGAGVGLIVNATPLGTRGECPPLPAALETSTLVVDLVYHPLVTPLLARAEAAGCQAFGGIGLLVHQAALSFELWTGTNAPLAVMRRAAEEAASP